MQRLLRAVLIAALASLTVFVGTVRATPRMLVGFYDDPSFRWAPAKQIPQNMLLAQRANASVIHVLADWSQIAPTKPKNPLNGNDPAYHLSDLDALVREAPRYNLSLLVTISQTPKWANGGQTPNHPPTHLADLTNFAHMLASRYSGHRPGYAAVRRWSVWNEPNLEQFLAPSYNAAGKPVSPREYVKIFLAAYKGIKQGSPSAMVAAGETSNRGHNAPTPGSDSIAPATFAHLVATADPKLPLSAWAEHPYPSNVPPTATQKVAYPNVALTNIDRFGADLEKWFHKRVPVWVTEWAEQTKPGFRFGVSYAQQARDVRTALKLVEQSKYAQMFVWFVFRDSDCSKSWCSGLLKPNGTKKPAYNAFAAGAKPLYGYTKVVGAGHPFNVTVDVPYMTYHDAPGTVVGVTYRVFQGDRTVAAIGQPRAVIAANQTITFKVNFKPLRGAPYLLTVNINDKHGQSEILRVQLEPAQAALPAKKTPAKKTKTTTAKKKK